MIKRTLSVLLAAAAGSLAWAQTPIAGALQSYNDQSRGQSRTQQYRPVGNAFVCENGHNRFTRALYGSPTDWRVETSDRPIFAVVKKGHHRSLRFVVGGVPLDSTDYCLATYHDGMREYELRDHRWPGQGVLRVGVVASPTEEMAVWRFEADGAALPLDVKAKVCQIANPKLKRNGDIGADAPGVFEPDPQESGLVVSDAQYQDERRSTGYVVVRLDSVAPMPALQAQQAYQTATDHFSGLARRIEFHTPNPYINALGSALVLAADGDWDGQTWLHGCIGWRMPLAGWRAAYVADVLGWNDRALRHFDAYAKSQVSAVPATIPHPSQDAKMNMARAEKKWGTQMYSDGYICRNPERNDQMHHYDMNLNYMDELLRHFMWDADTAYMRQMWPVIKSHLAWEKRNYDPDGDHLYDAYCCIWASDALYYSGGAVTHSSAYNYFDNHVAARIAKIIGEDPTPYKKEAEAIRQAMHERLWLSDAGHWAEYQDGMGLKRVHEDAAAWSYYTPIDCGAGTPKQWAQAIHAMSRNLPHISVENTPYHVIATSNWLPYSWSINNVATAETMHMALACFKAGQKEEGFDLLMGSVMDNMYYGQSPANFGQLSHYDAARGECYRDFGDCIGIASRALIEGLFGVKPDALSGNCLIRPGFPESWDSVTLKTPYIEYKFTRKDGKERYEITQNFRQPLTIVLARYDGEGWSYVDGTNEKHQVLEVASFKGENSLVSTRNQPVSHPEPAYFGLEEPDLSRPFQMQDIGSYFNSEVDDIFRNQYLSPRPQSTTLQIPVQGVGEWCHPQYTPVINDSVFRTLAVGNRFEVAGVPFSTPQAGRNVAYVSLWDNYPDALTIPLRGRASSAYLLMAGSTNHMQCRIDNGLVVATYKDGSTDTLLLRNPENWCPIEQDYFVDGQAFCTVAPRPYRIALGTGTVSRDLGQALGIKGVYGREIPGGAAQMLRMPLNGKKKLESLTLRVLSNDVVIGLMAVTLQ
ncbi:MAG: DUF4450 domain-containing protein [Prevotella sp.]|nr:DUF4450 domain-containing protein [Prevotella sp.]